MGRTSVPCGVPKVSVRARPGTAQDGEADGGGGLADGVAEHGGVDAGRRGLVVLAGGVQPDDGVEVDDAAGLVFGDLDVPDPDQGAELFLGDAQAAGQLAGQVGDEPAPQVPGVGVEQHRGLVVVAVRAHRLAEPGIVLGVPGGAGDVPAVRAAACVGVAAGTAGQHGLAAHPPGVHRPEGGGGEGGEHARVGGDRAGDAFASGQARADELPGVALVHRRAGRADGLAAVAARDGQHSAGLGSGVVERRGFSGGQVDDVGPAAQPDRPGAAAGAGELAFPGAEVGPGDGLGVVGVRSRSRAVGTGPGPRAAVAAVTRCLASWRCGCRGGGRRRRRGI